ncbi:MAG: hypothetical protein ABSB09_00500 [Acidimicrobiales bacterium]|jgi:hypothetical protein
MVTILGPSSSCLNGGAVPPRSGIADVTLAAAAIAPLGKDIVSTGDPRALGRA